MLFNNIFLRRINTLLDTPIFYAFIAYLLLHLGLLLQRLSLHSTSLLPHCWFEIVLEYAPKDILLFKEPVNFHLYQKNIIHITHFIFQIKSVILQNFSLNLNIDLL